MKFYFKTFSIRKQLLVFILPVVILVVVINALISYEKSSKNLFKRELVKKENIKEGVIQFADNHDLSLQLIEVETKHRLIELFKKVNLKSSHNLETINLDSLQRELEMDPNFEDIYIINKKGIVINTTQPKDLNLDFFNFGDSYKEFLLDVWKNKVIAIERIAIESSTLKSKKYGYFPINDNYILEFGISIKNIEKITENFSAKLKGLENRYNNVETINLFGATEVLRSKIDGKPIENNLKEVAINCYTEKEDTVIINQIKNLSTYTDLIYLDMRDAKYFKGYVLKIVTNNKLSIALIKYEFINFLIQLLISLFLVIIIILIITKKVINPINVLATEVSKMSFNSTISEIHINDAKETKILSDNFNLLSQKLNKNEAELEQKVLDKTAELNLKNSQLNKLLSERNTLIKEIHHRVKNNLQIIVSLLRLQSRLVSSNVAKDAFSDSIGRVQAMALLHEKLYKNSNYISVKSNKYLTDLIKLFKTSIPNNITINLSKNDIILNSSQAISIGLIINEFIVNSIKHGFKNTENGIINISLNAHSPKIVMTLTNNGQKLSKDFNIEKQDSLGMTIIDAFTDKLNGEFKLYNTENGVELRVVFNENPKEEEE